MSRKAGLNSWNFTAINSLSQLISPFHKGDYLIGFSLNLNFPGNCKALKKDKFFTAGNFCQNKTNYLGEEFKGKGQHTCKLEKLVFEKVLPPYTSQLCLFETMPDPLIALTCEKMNKKPNVSWSS